MDTLPLQPVDDVATRPADPRRDVHLSKPSRIRGRRARYNDRRERLRAFVPVLRLPIFFVAGIIMSVALVLAGVVGRYLHMGVIPSTVVFSLVGAAACALFFYRRYLPSPPPGVKYTLAPQPDESFRLRLAATERQVHRVLCDGLSGELFEPRVFFIPLALRRPAWPILVAYILFSVALGSAWFFLRFRLAATIGGLFFGPWDFWGVMMISLIPFAWMWPTYLRISPGRLEVIRYRFMGMGLPTITPIDLRTSRVLADLKVGLLRVQPEVGEEVVISLSEWCPPWTDIARALFEAARHEGALPAELPRDALVG